MERKHPSSLISFTDHNPQKLKVEVVAVSLEEKRKRIKNAIHAMLDSLDLKRIKALLKDSGILERAILSVEGEKKSVTLSTFGSPGTLASSTDMMERMVLELKNNVDALVNTTSETRLDYLAEDIQGLFYYIKYGFFPSKKISDPIIFSSGDQEIIVKIIKQLDSSK